MVNTEDATCSDVIVMMDRNYSEPFDLKLHLTQNDCTIPNVEFANTDPGNDFELLAEQTSISPEVRYENEKPVHVVQEHHQRKIKA